MPRRLKVFSLERLPSIAVSRWYLSLDYYWPLYAVSLFPIVYAEMQSYKLPGSKEAMLKAGLQTADIDSLWLRWTLLKLTSALVVYLLLLGYSFFLKSRGIKNIRAFHLFLIGLVVGIVSGFLQHFLIGKLEIFETGTFFARITAPVTWSVSILFTLSVLTSNVRKYRKNNEIAEDQIRALSNVSQKQKLILEAYSDYSKKVQDRVSKTSDVAIQRLNDLKSRDDLLNPNVSVEIRLISDSTIRDLSHEIEKSYNFSDLIQKRKVSINMVGYFFRLLKESIHFAPLHPIIFSFGYVFLISGALIKHAEWKQAISAMIGLFVVIALIQILGVILFKAFRWQNFYSISLIILLSANFPLFLLKHNIFNFRALVPDITRYPPNPGLFMVSITTVTLVGYIQQAGLMASADLIKLRKSKVINSQNAIKPINKEIVQISRNWARHLHGSVQGQILAETVALENAQRNSDLRGIEISMQNIATIFERASQLKPLESVTLLEELKKRISHWGDFIEIEFEISEEIKGKSGYQVAVLGDIIEEMIANASRHGLASKIKIEVFRRSGAQLYIKAVDNGTQFSNVEKGFGSRFFDEVSLGRWEISRSHTLRETTVALVYELENNFIFKSIVD